MISLWLSHDNNLINSVNNINHYQFLFPDDVIYKYYFDVIPKGRRFIRWTKKDQIDKKRKDKIQKIKEQYNVSKNEAMGILNHMEYLGEKL